MSGHPLLSVQNVCKAYGGVAAARNVSFHVDPGEMVALIGPNGAGKSTIFNIVGGQLSADTGKILLNGEDVTALKSRDLALRGVGRTFQVAQTFTTKTVLENVQLAIISLKRASFRLWPPSRLLYRDEAMDVLNVVRMQGFADRTCGSLSYGDVKKVELAMALAGEPRLLLMDEPTAGMAAFERMKFMELTSSLAENQRIGILFTEHDVSAVFSHANRVQVLVRGEVIAEGRTDEIRNNVEVQNAYLGKAGADVETLVRKTRRA